ncbi:MAG: SIS domain-containing protein [Nitrospirae bacterium]|nr:MAG: SIS domain-containing protein [Nitrospirota bacterium]
MDEGTITSRFYESGEVKRRFVQTYAPAILVLGELLARAFRDGHKLLLFGNGGSATDASHIAAEFVGRYNQDRPPLPALALTTDMAAVTCVANDYDYTRVFARQIEAHGRTGDIVIALSTSGNSPNVLKGVEAASRLGLITVGWTGRDGGKLAGMVAYPFLVPSTVTARVQECHLTLGHVLCEIVEEKLFATTS